NGLIEGMNGMQGITQLQNDIVAAYPNIVLGGESTNEIIAPDNWLAQRWTANSPAHPISTYLMGGQVFFYGFLDQPAPEEAGFSAYLARYEGQGVVPVVFVVNAADLGADRTLTHEVLSYMKTLQSEQFAPDWKSDWSNLEFRQVSSDGKSQLTVQDDGKLVAMKQDGNLLYQRVHDSNS